MGQKYTTIKRRKDKYMYVCINRKPWVARFACYKFQFIIIIYVLKGKRIIYEHWFLLNNDDSIIVIYQIKATNFNTDYIIRNISRLRKRLPWSVKQYNWQEQGGSTGLSVDVDPLPWPHYYSLSIIYRSYIYRECCNYGLSI